MLMSLSIDGANCPVCLNETIDSLRGLEGVRTVHASLAGPCIEIIHDEIASEAIAATIRDRLRRVELFSNEIGMAPVETAPLATPCQRHRAEKAPLESSHAVGAEIVPSMTLAEIVTLHPSLAADLERRGLDYCCHGLRTLAVAAAEAGLDPDAVARELSAVSIDEPPAAWASLDPAGLVDHIETVHHRYLWLELPRVSALVDKIVAVHGASHPELSEVARLYGELRADLEPHLRREEQVLFPRVRQQALDAPWQAAAGDTDCIAELAAEHDAVGSLLDELRRVTSGYATPADGCATYAACYRALAALEEDTHLHVHKENNVLFPAVRAAIAGRESRGASSNT